MEQHTSSRQAKEEFVSIIDSNKCSLGRRRRREMEAESRCVGEKDSHFMLVASLASRVRRAILQRAKNDFVPGKDDCRTSRKTKAN